MKTLYGTIATALLLGGAILWATPTDTKAQANEPMIQVHLVGKIDPTRYSNDQVYVFWFTNGDNECYVTSSEDFRAGGGISCMKKGN